MALMTTGSGGITPTYQTYFNKQLLSAAQPMIVTAQFAQKKPFPKNMGAQTIRFFRPQIADRTRVSALTEGVPISTFQEITYTPIDVTLTQSGEAAKISDIVSYTDLFSTLDGSVKMFGEDAGVYADFECVKQIVTGTDGTNGASKRYAGGATDFTTLSALSSANGKIQIQDLLGSFTKLTLTKAKKPEGGAYATIVTPEQAYDIMSDAKFVDSGTRGTTKGLYNGTIGTWYGNNIMSTTEGWREQSGGTEGTYSTSGTGVFSAMVLGREALGAAIMAGQSPFSPSIIVNDKPDSGNPLKQFITAGWKCYWATKLLNGTWAVVIRSKSSYS